MKNLKYIFAVLALCIGISSCWKEDIPERGAARHQVENLVATPGDEEVVLSWTMPEGWNPTDFLITYNDANSEPVSIKTGGEMTYTIDGLQNEFAYSFGVQAMYGEAISGKVEVGGKPTTSRFPMSDPLIDTGDGYVTLIWEKPSTLVLSYTIRYFMDGDESNAKEVTVDKDALQHKFEGLTNDKNYTFIIVVNYAKGPSEELIVKAMPAFAIPYFVSATSVAQGQPVTYQFNRTDYPTATDVTWTFPDGAVKTGDEVTHGINAFGIKEVILSANVNGVKKEWKIELNIRQWVVSYGYQNWDLQGKAYAGFRGSYPVLSPDGKTVYALPVMNFTAVYAFDVQTGEKKWHYNADPIAAGYNPPTVNPVTGDIYFGTNSAGQFYSVSPDGKLNWTFTEAQSMKSAAPAVSADGTVVYISDTKGNTFAIDAATGTKKWGVALGSQSSGLLVNGSDLVVAIKKGTDNVLFLNAADGTTITTLSITATKNGPTEMTGFAVADDKKTAYIPLAGGNSNPGGSGMAKIDLATRTLVKAVAFADNDCYAPVVGSNGFIIVGSKDGLVYGVNSELEVQWTFNHVGGETPTASTLNYSHICANAAGQAFVGCGNKNMGNTCYVLDVTNGNVIENYRHSTENSSYAMSGGMFHDGVFYFCTAGSEAPGGEFFGKYVGGADKFWGGPGGDICGSGCVQSPLFN